MEIVTILSSILILCLAIMLATQFFIAQKNKQLAETQKKLTKIQNMEKNLLSQLDKKKQQFSDLNRRLEHSKEEIKKQKKKLYLLEQKDNKNQTQTTNELDKIQEQALEEAREKASFAQAEASKANENVSLAKNKLEQTCSELADKTKQLRDLQEKTLQTQKYESSRLIKLEKENQLLQQKITSAQRKVKTEIQVHKVTKSKLELAMEKIKFLDSIIIEKALRNPAQDSHQPDLVEEKLSNPEKLVDETNILTKDTEQTPHL